MGSLRNEMKVKRVKGMLRKGTVLEILIQTLVHDKKSGIFLAEIL